MATRKTITKAPAVRYRNASRAVKSEILDVVCAVAGHHRDYAPSGSAAGADASGGQGAGRAVTEV